MPELPEVETTLRGIKPHLIAQTVAKVIVRHHQLRWPIPHNLEQILQHQTILDIQRRGKYLLFITDIGTLILHLGMSGRVCILSEFNAAKKHDHVDIFFANQTYLRFTDPRRFGALLWTDEDPHQHPLLINIGPEPLSNEFDGHHLWEHARGRTISVKAYIMNSKIVAGVGNIYATEALFQSCIRPAKSAGKVSLAHYEQLATSIKNILAKAIKKGGTTLKDFRKSDGSPGYFSLELQAYGRCGLPCLRCQTLLKSSQIGQRSTVYCPRCQK